MAMEVILDDIWVCDDCLFMAVNGDSPEDEARALACEAGLADLGKHVVPDFDSETGDGMLEFSYGGCDCCGCRLGGSRHRFAVLGEVAP